MRFIYYLTLFNRRFSRRLGVTRPYSGGHSATNFQSGFIGESGYKPEPRASSWPEGRSISPWASNVYYSCPSNISCSFLTSFGIQHPTASEVMAHSSPQSPAGVVTENMAEAPAQPRQRPSGVVSSRPAEVKYCHSACAGQRYCRSKEVAERSTRIASAWVTPTVSSGGLHSHSDQVRRSLHVIQDWYWTANRRSDLISPLGNVTMGALPLHQDENCTYCHCQCTDSPPFRCSHCRYYQASHPHRCFGFLGDRCGDIAYLLRHRGTAGRPVSESVINAVTNAFALRPHRTTDYVESVLSGLSDYHRILYLTAEMNPLQLRNYQVLTGNYGSMDPIFLGMDGQLTSIRKAAEHCSPSDEMKERLDASGLSHNVENYVLMMWQDRTVY